MTTRPEPFITSVHVEPYGGPHEGVTIWIRGQCVGTLTVGKGDGERLAALLRHGDLQAADADGAAGFAIILSGADPPYGLEARDWPLSAGLKTRLTTCFICRREKCRCTNASTCGRCHGCTLFEAPARIDDHPTAEAGPGAPAPSPPAANEEPGLESRPPGVPPAAGAPPTSDPRVRAQRRISRALDEDTARTLERHGYQVMRCTRCGHPNYGRSHCLKCDARCERQQPRRMMPVATHCPADLAPDERTRAAAAELGIHDAKLDHIVRDFVSYWTGPAGHTLLSDWQGKLRRRLYELQSDRQHFEAARQNAIEDSWREEETLP